IDGGGQFVRSGQAADVNGDGKAEIVVATDKVRVYSGTGKKLWEYAAPASAGDVVFADVSFGDGHLYAQYAQHPGHAGSHGARRVAGGLGVLGVEVAVAERDVREDDVAGRRRGRVLPQLLAGAAV
ncbi:FG-GAP repeat domain-containing protein, partial [Streptomyces beijiangensis]